MKVEVTPYTIQVGAHTFKVVYDDDAINAISVGQQSDLIGYTCRRDQTIILRKGMGVDMEAETLLHEVLHACFGMVGLEGLDEKITEEEIIDRLAPILLDTMRRNPGLVQDLMQVN